MNYAVIHLDFDDLESYRGFLSWIKFGLKKLDMFAKRIQCIEKRYSSSRKGGHIRMVVKCGNEKFEKEYFIFFRYFLGDCFGRIQADMQRKVIEKYFQQSIETDTLFAYKDGKWAGPWKLIYGDKDVKELKKDI